MSQENEAFIRSAYARFNGGERVPPADLWHTDSEYINSASDPDPAIHRGLEAVRKQFEWWVETYPDLRVEPLEVLVNADRVFVWAQWSGQAAVNGAPVEMQMAQVWTVEGRQGAALRGVRRPRRCPRSPGAAGVVKDGRIVRVTQGYADKDAAPDAARLGE